MKMLVDIVIFGDPLKPEAKDMDWDTRFYPTICDCFHRFSETHSSSYVVEDIRTTDMYVLKRRLYAQDRLIATTIRNARKCQPTGKTDLLWNKRESHDRDGQRR
jgi:hypothetical protein